MNQMILREVEYELIDPAVTFAWRPLGPVQLNLAGTLSFHKAPRSPGVYRLGITMGEGISVYVGESTNVHNRLHNGYGGRTERLPTDVRIRRTIVSALTLGARVSASVMIDLCLYECGVPTAHDLTNTDFRREIERAALLAELIHGNEILNIHKPRYSRIGLLGM